MAGDLRCRVLADDGTVAFAERCIVLPPGTRARVTAAQGSLRLTGFRAAAAEPVDLPAGVTCTATVDATGDVELRASGDPLERVLGVVVTWATGGTARLRLANPRPVHGYRDGDRLLPNGAKVAVDRLPLLVAESYGTAGSPSNPERPRLHIDGYDGAIDLPAAGGESGLFALPLDEIVPLLRASLAVADRGPRSTALIRLRRDGAVTQSLEVVWNCGKLWVADEPPPVATTFPAGPPASPDPAIKVDAEVPNDTAVLPAEVVPPDTAVARDMGQPVSLPAVAAASQAEPECEAVRLWLPNELVGDDVRVEVRPLAEPDAEPHMAVPHEWTDDRGTARRGWRFAFAGRVAGAWLATAWRGDRMVAPARFIDVRGSHAVEAAVLRLAAMVTIEQEDARRLAWRFEYPEMVRRPGHELWPPVLAMADACGRIPPETFDPLREVAGNPDALATLVARAAEPAVVIEQFAERLPVLWQALPAASWHRAFLATGYHQRSTMLNGGFGLARADEAIRWRLDRVVDACLDGGRPIIAAAWAASRLDALKGDAAPKSRWQPIGAEMTHYLIRPLWEERLARRGHEPQVRPEDHASLTRLSVASLAKLLPTGAAGDPMAHAALLAAAVAAGQIAAATVPAAALKRARAIDRAWFDAACQFWTATLLTEHPPKV
ncbi:MAG TPA: hypothetical protein VF796_02980 [Humisphaera sp.]